MLQYAPILKLLQRPIDMQVPRARDTEFEQIVVETMETEPLGLNNRTHFNNVTFECEVLCK